MFPFQQRRRVVRGRSLDRLTRQIQIHHGLRPAHMVKPFRRDQDLVSQPPVARVNDQILNRPGLLVDQQSLYVPDVAIGRVYVVVSDCIHASQMRIVRMTF